MVAISHGRLRSSSISEGGWSGNPADPGGGAMKGITLANFRRTPAV
ncbi:glycosyl hydrolase 108 family protein [Mesorhizobium sp. M0139]